MEQTVTVLSAHVQLAVPGSIWLHGTFMHYTYPARWALFSSMQLTDLNHKDITWLVTISSHMQSPDSKSGQIWWCRFTSAPLGGFYIMVHQQRVRVCSGKRLHSGLKSARKRPKGATPEVEPAIPA